MQGDEAYAGSRSTITSSGRERFDRLKHVIPTHQGRASERLLFSHLVKPGQMILNNTHFDTTRANIEHQKGEAVDLLPQQYRDPTTSTRSRAIWIRSTGDALQEIWRERIPLVMLTVTNNAAEANR